MFGKNIAWLRRQKGLSQRELAKELKISSGALGMYETERREPDFSTLERIAAYFGTDVPFILTGKQSADSDPLLERVRNLSPESRMELEKYAALLEMKETQERNDDSGSKKLVI